MLAQSILEYMEDGRGVLAPELDVSSDIYVLACAPEATLVASGAAVSTNKLHH